LAERQASLRATADAAQSGGRPQVSVVAAVEPARPNSRFVPRVDEWNTGWDLGVNATWTIFDGGRARAEHAGAVAEADAIQHRIDDFDATVTVEVRQRLLDLATARAALSASGEAVTAAAEARRVLSERFLVGVATNTEVLDADVAWLEAELEQTRLQAALRLSEARLLRTAGDT
jgi:OMF family outer membrane factor